MGFTIRPMSGRERRLNSLAGVALAVAFAGYGLHFILSDRMDAILKGTWLAFLGLAIVFEATSRVFRRLDRRPAGRR
jgi:hypothetical protein